MSTAAEASLRIVLDGASAGEAGPRVLVRGADGRARTPKSDDLIVAAPLGPTRVVVGAPFSGWSEAVYDLELTANGATLTLPARREATLTVTIPDQTAFLHVQAGDDSVTRDEFAEAPLRLHVPPNERVVLWLETYDGAAYRRELAPLARGQDRAVSLVDACVRESPAVASLPKCRLTFDVRLVGAVASSDEVHARLSHALGEEELELDGTSHFEFELPRDDLYRVEFRCDASRCVPVVVVGRVPDAAASARSVELVARARVTFAKAKFVHGPGAYSVNPNLEQPGLDEDGVDLAPGLALLEVYEGKEKRVVELDLKAGEVRALEEP